MPFRHSIDSTSRTVLVVFSGQSSMDEAIELRLALAADPLFRAEFDELVDLRSLSASNSSFEEISARGDKLDPFSQESRRAVVAPGDFAYGMARMYATIRQNNARFEIFRSLPDACRWLNLDDSAVQRLFYS